jgi:small subunit ribosomal protein S4
MSKRIELPKYLRKKALAAAEAPNSRRPKLSEYGKQLREKQRARFTYGLREKQFHNYFVQASRSGQATGEMLLQLLERRLDNVIYRLSLTASRAQARQFVSHGHVTVNGAKVSIPSYLVKDNDVVAIVKTEPQPREVEVPSWLTFNKKTNSGTINRLPSREDMDQEINEQLIVEFYSR